MSDYRLTLEDAIAGMRDVVKDEEDFVYNKSGVRECWYVEGAQYDGEAWNTEDARPSCLVGQFLIKHTPVTMMDLVIDSRNSDIVSYLLDELVYAGVIDSYEREAATFLRHAQRIQDDGGSWGDALKVALIYVD